MYVYMHVYVFIYMYLYVYVFICICIHTCTGMYTNTCLNTYTYMYEYNSIHTHPGTKYIDVHACSCVREHVCTYVLTLSPPFGLVCQHACTYVSMYTCVLQVYVCSDALAPRLQRACSAKACVLNWICIYICVNMCTHVCTCTHTYANA
jgi:hypothetical protein